MEKCSYTVDLGAGGIVQCERMGDHGEHHIGHYYQRTILHWGAGPETDAEQARLAAEFDAAWNARQQPLMMRLWRWLSRVKEWA